jgi:hypothetical protein
MDAAFWKSVPGMLTIAAGGVAVVGGVAYAVSKATTPAVPAAPAAVTTSTGGSGAYYLFDVTTPYISNDPTGAALKSVTAALVAAGFSPTALQIQMDPENANGWVASGIWLGTGAPTMPAVSGAISNAQLLSTVPPTPTGYPGLVAGQWYPFSILTFFTPSAVNAQQNAAALAASLGFDPTSIQIAPASSNTPTTPAKWNVVGQWLGTAGATVASDFPPLLIIVPPGPNAANAAATAPTVTTAA